MSPSGAECLLCGDVTDVVSDDGRPVGLSPQQPLPCVRKLSQMFCGISQVVLSHMGSGSPEGHAVKRCCAFTGRTQFPSSRLGCSGRACLEPLWVWGQVTQGGPHTTCLSAEEVKGSG